MNWKCKLGFHEWTAWIGFPVTEHWTTRKCQCCDMEQKSYQEVDYAQLCLDFFAKIDKP